MQRDGQAPSPLPFAELLAATLEPAAMRCGTCPAVGAPRKSSEKLAKNELCESAQTSPYVGLTRLGDCDGQEPVFPAPSGTQWSSSRTPVGRERA